MEYTIKIKIPDDDELAEYIKTLPSNDIDFNTDIIHAIKYYFSYRVFPKFDINRNYDLYTSHVYFKKIRDWIINKNVLNILCLNINNFKNINNSYGLSFGDKILKQYAQELHALYAKENIYYFGSDKFLVKLNDINNYKIPKVINKENNITIITRYSLFSIRTNEITKDMSFACSDYLYNLIKTIIDKGFYKGSEAGYREVVNLQEYL